MRRGLLFSLLLVALLSGCELVADFDRGKIPTDAGGPGDGDGDGDGDAATDEDAGADEDAG